MGTLKIQLTVETEDVRTIRISIQIESDSDLTAQASAAVGAAITAILQTPRPIAVQPVSNPTPNETTVAPTAPAVRLSTRPPALAPAPITKAPIDSHRRELDRRDWSKFSLGFGVLLVLAALTVAAVFPPLVPPKQRIEVFMMSFAFGLLGTLALFSDAMPRREGRGGLDVNVRVSASPVPLASTPRAPAAPTSAAARQALLRKTRGSRSVSQSAWGIGFGVVFVLAGIAAPFMFGNTGADERFLMMLGFAPVVVVGIILMAVFWHRVQPAPAKVAAVGRAPMPTSAARPPVPRAPAAALFKLGIPAVLAPMSITLIVVITLVIIATIVPLLR